MGQQTSTIFRLSDVDPGQARITGADGGTPIDVAVTYGQDDDGADLKVFGDTSGTYMMWDESVDSFLIPGTTGRFQIGGFTGAASGTGSVVSASATAPFKVFADDGGAAIGSGSLVRAGWFRNLQTYTGGNREQEACGVQGSLVSVAGTNRHNMCGVLGSYEARTSLTVGGQAAATDTWCQAGVIGRVGMSSGTLTLDTNGVLAGVAAMSNINTATTATYTGEYCGFYVGAWASADDFEIGLLIEDGKVTMGIDIGTCTTGIEFTGTTTNCISVPASATGITKLIRVGTWGNDVVLAADDEFIELLCQVSGNTHSKPLVRFRMEGAGVNMTTGSIIALECLAYMNTTYTAHDMTAIVAHTGAKGTSALTATAKMRAAYLKIEDLGNDLDLVSGSYACPLWMEMQFNSGSTFSGNMYWCSFSKYGSETSLYGDAVFRFEDLSGGGWATSFVLMDNGRPPWSTGGASGATGSDAKLRCDIGGVHYSIALYAE